MLFSREGRSRKLSRHAKGHPLRLTTFASSPKGTPLRYAGNFPAIAKSRPLGEGGIAAGDDGRGIPAAPRFRIKRCCKCCCPSRPTCEKGIQKRPQAFLNPEFKIIFPLKMARVQQRRPPPAVETGRSCWGSGQQDASAAQGTMRMLGAATR